MKFTLIGEPTGCGKNNIKVTRSGYRIPTPLFEDWKERCSFQIIEQCRPYACSDTPMFLIVDYYPKNRRRRDATAILDGLFHVLEYTGLIKDDAQIKGLVYNERSVDKASPRLDVVLVPAGELEEG